MESHDLAIPLLARPLNTARARTKDIVIKIVLLEPSLVVAQRTLDASHRRLTSLLQTAAVDDVLICFLLNGKTGPGSPSSHATTAVEPMDAFMLLQARLLASPELRNVQVLPVVGIDTLVPTLRTHIGALVSQPRLPALPPPAAVARELVKLCTPAAPRGRLSRRAVEIIRETLPNLAALATAAVEAATSGEFDDPRLAALWERLLAEGLLTDADALLDFWAAEWVIE